MGHARGSYDTLHPNDHVKASQSTNDVYPTALRMSAWIGIGELLCEMAALRQAFEAKAAEFIDVLKIGRTQLQDAVPMTLGQELMAFAVMIGEDEQRLNGVIVSFLQIDTLTQKDFNPDKHLQDQLSRTRCAFGAD